MLSIYQEYFEMPFLQDTQEFYRQESISYLQNHSVMDYLFKVYTNLQLFTQTYCLYVFFN